MVQISDFLRGGPDHRTYWCEGCEEPHSVSVQINGQGPGWTFDGDEVRPTFGPSVLVTSGHYVAGFDPAKDRCWCTYNAEQIAKGASPSGFQCERCHTFIRGGMVEFLGDCTHALAGQTRPLPPLPPHLRDDRVLPAD